MNHESEDNIYPIGAILSSKVAPLSTLRIIAYKQRIYYCTRVDDESIKPLAYFERELLPPAASGKTGQ